MRIRRGRSFMPFIVTAVVLAVLLGWTSVAASKSSGGSSTSASRTLRVVLDAEPLSLDPSIDIKQTTIDIDQMFMQALAHNEAHGTSLTVQPQLAQSWHAITPTHWRIKLRQGVMFQNGEPFNAKAVAFSIGVYHKTTGDPKGQYDFITSARVVNNYTIDLYLNAPNAVLPSLLPGLYMFPPKYYAKVGPEGFGKHPIGTGPWQFVDWKPGVGADVKAWSGYWGPKPAISQVHFQWAPDPSTRAAEIQTGQVDLAEDIPPSMISQVNSSSSAHVETVESLRNFYIQMNIEQGPTSNVLVREALNYATNKTAIMQHLFGGRAYPDAGINNYAGFEGYQKNTPWPYDPAKAKQLLAQAGYPNGFNITFYTPNGAYLLDSQTAQAVAGQWAAVGINAKVVPLESGQYFTVMAKAPGKTDIPRSPDGYALGVNLYSCAPDYFNAMGCAAYAFLKVNQRGYAANNTTDSLYYQYFKLLKSSQRVKLVHAYNNYVYKKYVPWVWLWRFQDDYGVSKQLNWSPRPDQYLELTAASFK